MRGAPDHRLNAFRPDLADARLRGRVDAARFVDGDDRVVVDPVGDLRREPRPDAGVDTQVLMGDRVRVFETTEGWAWVQATHDGYVGYMSADALAPMQPKAAGAPHRVHVPRTFLYAEPDLKTPVIETLSMGALVDVVDTVETRGTAYARLPNDLFCVAIHVRAADDHADDYVGVAATLERTPYLWGGTSGFGVDCSGLVQLSMRMAGRSALRDTDMQETSVGIELAPDAPLERGDLVFWKGHVGIMRDAELLVHANGHSMDVVSEPLDDAIGRIARLYGQPTTRRRP